MNTFLKISGAVGAIAAGAMYLGSLEQRLRTAESELESLQTLVGDHGHDELSRLRFRFVVVNEDDESGGPLPDCKEGWQNQADFRISHLGGERGEGGGVRLCTRIEPSADPAN